jgi:hypothetical protein
MNALSIAHASSNCIDARLSPMKSTSFSEIEFVCLKNSFPSFSDETFQKILSNFMIR